MISLREFADKLIGSAETVDVTALATLLDLPHPISIRDMLEGSLYCRLNVGSVKCLATETQSGPDRCRLEVFTDGVLERSLRRSLGEQETWPVQASYLFRERVKIKLWDEDSPDPDDLLDTVLIEAQPCQTRTVPMTGDGADYRLTYDVGYRLLPKDFDPVLAEISSFEQSALAGAWPQIAKADLVTDLTETVADPLRVRQDSTPLCGPTAIVYELVARDAGHGLRPQRRRYVQLCRQLYETGHISARSMEIEPSEDLRDSPLSAENRLSVADWMLIATLRDAENEFEDVEGDVSGIEGYTFPAAMKTWIFEILGFDDANWEACVFFGEIPIIKKAHSCWSKGGVAFLNIHSNLLKGKPAGLLPNHWVPYLGGLQLDDATGMIGFNCYSWGKIFPVSMSQEAFAEYLFGAVLGER